MDLQTVLTALRNADAAGNVEDARRLAQIADRLSRSAASPLDDEVSRLEREREEIRSRKFKPETTFGGNVKEFFKGIVPGAVGLAETAGTGISALLPDETEKSVRGKIKEYAEAAKKPFEAGEGYEESVGRKLGEGLGSTLPFFAAGPLGVAGRVGAAGVGVAAGAGEAREAAEAKGVTGSDRATATLLGAPTGLLDILAPEIKPFKGMITTALARGGVEGATEAAQKISQNLIAKGVYDPQQEILVGSGEEGAYGAGVGALASLILDMTLGRKARGVKPSAEKPGAETPGAATPAEPLLLEHTTKFQPVVAPDGSVITSQAEYDAYQKAKRGVASERAEDIRTSDPLAGLSEFDRGLARKGKEAALEETFAQGREGAEGTVYPSEPGQMDIPGIERATKVEAAPEEVTQEPSKRDDRTRDMIDELETSQIEEMVSKDTSAELRSLLDKEQERVDRIRASASQRRYDKEQKEQAERLAILLPIIESPAQPNIPKVFVQTLKREGFANLKLTERERNLINRAYDIRLAEEPAPEVEPSAPAENAAMEAAIPEKVERRVQEQPSPPDMGKPKGEAPKAFSDEELATQEAKPLATTLTADVLASVGLPKQSGLYKQLLNMDMADPAQQPVIGSIFAKARSNPNLTQATKDAIERLGMQAFGGAATRQELPGMPKTPKGKRNEPTSTANAGANAAPTGAGTTGAKSVAPQPTTAKRDAAAGRAETPKPAGVGAAGQPASVAGVGEGSKPSAVTEKNTKAEAPAEKKAKPEEQKAKVEAPAEKKAEPTSDNAYVLAKEQGEGAHAIRTLAADAYLNSAEDYSVKRAEAMIKDLEDGNVPELKFGKNNSNGPGTGGKYAKAFYESLSADEKAQFNKELQSFLYSEIRSKQYMEAYNKSQELARAEVEGDASELIKDANVMATALHPEVVRMLKANDLLGALRFVAGQKLGRASDVANALADKLQGVDVEVADFKSPPGILQRLFDRQPDAQNAPGIYAITKQGKRVIFLDSNTGLDTWALLHEATHGAADATLGNPSHPLTKQLTQLFNDVKDSLDTSYGATDVKEFAAEAFSNPGFQRKLAAINPKGEKITAWQRFVHAVKNFLRSIVGMPTKGMESALDSADYMIEAIVNGHAGTSGSLGTVSLLNRGSALFEAMGERAKSLPRLDDEKAAQINELYVRAKASVRNVIRQSLPLNALVEVAQKYIPMAPKLDTLIGERSGAENKRNQMIEPVINRVEGWAKSNPDKLDAFNRVVYQSTLGQVDPSKPRSDYAGKMDDSGNKKDVAWDELQKDWRSLGADGQSVYKQMRDTYEKMYSEVRDVLNARIDNALEDPDTRKKVKAEIYQRLFSKGSIEPYFPLTRSGKYWLSYSLGGEFFVEAYETAYMRDKAVQALGTEGATDVQKFANLNQINYRKAPATSFVNNVLRTLEANKVNANVTEEVMRLFLNTLPETSFAQAFRRRKGTLGFDHDAIGALRSKTFNLSRQLSNMEYGAKLEKLRQTMEEYVRSQGNKDEAVEMMNELSARIDYAISPNVPKWSKLATSFGFNMTLGLNVSSALVNLSQIPLVVAPYLGGKYGVADTAKAIGRATKYFVGSGFDRESTMLVPTDKGEKKVKVRAFPSMDNYDFSKADAPKHLKVLSEVAGERGQLNRSQIYDTLEVGEDTSLMTKVNAVTGFVFHHGERMNRQVALIATYELELQKLVGKGKDFTKATEAQQRAAADYAVYVTELTNGGTAAAAAPRIAQGAIGKVVFMYKRYGVSMYYMLFKTARDALKSADPEVRTAAKRQIAGIYASAALMAGVQGIPMFGIASMLYNLILKDDDEDDFDTMARKWMGEGAYSGALNALTGLEISGRIGLADLLFRDTNTKPSDSVMLSLMETLGGPVFGVASRVERGLKLIGDGNVERGIEQIMPSAIGNALKSIRFATEGANTLRGDPITGDLGYWNPFAQFFGFAPAEYTRQLEINSSLKNIERTALEEKTNLLRKYYVATRVGDSDAAADILDKMLEHNRKFPGSAITPDTIKRSMAQHLKTSAEMYHGVTLNKSLRPQLLANAAEYEDEE